MVIISLFFIASLFLYLYVKCLGIGCLDTWCFTNSLLLLSSGSRPLFGTTTEGSGDYSDAVTSSPLIEGSEHLYFSDEVTSSPSEYQELMTTPDKSAETVEKVISSAISGDQGHSMLSLITLILVALVVEAILI